VEKAGRRIFEGASVAVEEGEVLFVVGPSGSGKSLLLRALSALDPFDGRISLDGRTVEDWGGSEWRAEVCYLAQEPAVLAGSPAALLERALGFAAQRRRGRGEASALTGFATALGLERSQIEGEWGVLSGGERARAALAVALSLKPRFLLLDEPTAALDPASVGLVERVLGESAAAKVWVSHDPGQPQRVGGRLLHWPPERR